MRGERQRGLTGARQFGDSGGEHFALGVGGDADLLNVGLLQLQEAALALSEKVGDEAAVLFVDTDVA